MRSARRIGAIGAALAVAAAGLLAGGPAATAATAVRTCTSAPFVANPRTSTWYRIPAVVATHSGALLAFAEQRGSSDPSSDTGVTRIVEARSTDRGCSWSAPVVVADDGDATVGNPSPVVATDGTVLLLSVDRPHAGGRTTSPFHGLHVQRSIDDGLHFSAYGTAVADLSGVKPAWHAGFTGPGHGLVLTSGPHAGRIVVPTFFYDDGSGDFGASDVYSDDAGASWRLGYVQEGSDERMEGTAAQLPSGDLWLSYHRHDGMTPVGHGRLVATSADGGASLSSAFTTLPLPVISVEASSLVVQGGPYAGELLVAQPGRPDVVGGKLRSNTRQLMTIFTGHGVTAARPAGTSWSQYPVGLDDTPASYSDLVQLDASTVGILYETGTQSWHERIAFTTVPIAALTAGATVVSKVAISAGKDVWRGHVVVRALVQVPGTRSPAGRVTITMTSKQHRYTTTSEMAHDTTSQRVAVWDRVPKGVYTVQVRYSGTLRIKPASAKPFTITVH